MTPVLPWRPLPETGKCPEWSIPSAETTQNRRFWSQIVRFRPKGPKTDDLRPTTTVLRVQNRRKESKASKTVESDHFRPFSTLSLRGGRETVEIDRFGVESGRNWSISTVSDRFRPPYLIDPPSPTILTPLFGHGLSSVNSGNRPAQCNPPHPPKRVFRGQSGLRSRVFSHFRGAKWH